MLLTRMINYYLLVNPKKQPQHIWHSSTWATSAWIKFILVLPKFWKNSALYAETSFALALVLMSNFSSYVAKSWCSWLDVKKASIWLIWWVIWLSSWYLLDVEKRSFDESCLPMYVTPALVTTMDSHYWIRNQVF